MRNISRKCLSVRVRRSYSAAPEGKPMAKHTGIRKLPNGRFRARYFQGYDAKTGKRIYPARTFDTERDARDWRAGETIAKGSNVVEGRGLSLSAYIDHWLSTKINLRSNTRQLRNHDQLLYKAKSWTNKTLKAYCGSNRILASRFIENLETVDGGIGTDNSAWRTRERKA